MPNLTYKDANLYYEIHGSHGEPILLIQGVGVIGNGWKPQVDGLASRHSLLHYDNRGFGKSTNTSKAPLTIEQFADDAAALIEAAGWSSCHVVGHSMGGVIAQRLALRHPTVVRSLILMFTVAKGADAIRMTPGMLLRSIRMHVGSMNSRRRAFLGLIYPASDLAQRDSDELAAELAPLFGYDLGAQPSFAMKQAMVLKKHDCSMELAALGRFPTLVISAEHDEIAPPRFGRAHSARIPGAKFMEIKGASHGVAIQHRDTVNKIIEQFVINAHSK